jgi:hypothetical protein
VTSFGHGGEGTAPDSARIRPYLRTPPRRPDGVSAGGGAPKADAREEFGGQPPGLRPFVITAGRVDAADPKIDLETQVTARQVRRANPPLSALGPELQAIIALCREPVSVAEISARLRLHLGVVRILVGDLRVAGYVDVHGNTAAPTDPDTILRVIRGLRAIS